MAIDVSLLVRIGKVRSVDVVCDGHEDLGHDDERAARYIELLDGFAEDNLAFTVGVDIGSTDVSDERTDTYSKVLMPALYAVSMCLTPSSSSRTQGCHLRLVLQRA